MRIFVLPLLQINESIKVLGLVESCLAELQKNIPISVLHYEYSAK